MLDMWIGGSVPGMEAAGLSATRREPVPAGYGHRKAGCFHVHKLKSCSQ